MGSARPMETLRGFATSRRIEQVQIHDARSFDEAISAAFSPTNAHRVGRRPVFRRLYSSDATLTRSSVRDRARYFLPVALLITVSVALVELLAASEAVTVRRLGPFFKSIAAVLHEEVSSLAMP